MPYEITQCYLPFGSGRIPPLSPAESGTRVSDPKGMQSRVDLCYVKADRPGIEPAICKSQVQRPTAKPPSNTTYGDSTHVLAVSVTQFSMV